MGKSFGQNGSRNSFKILTGKFKGNIIFGRRRHGWEDKIRMYPKEIGIDTRNFVDSA